MEAFLGELGIPIPSSVGGVDADYPCQEARLRTIFRLLIGLTRAQQDKLRSGLAGAVLPPVAVAEFILAVCVEFLCDLFILPDNVKNWWWDRGIANFRPPRINFEAWIRGDKTASFLVGSSYVLVAKCSSMYNDYLEKRANFVLPSKIVTIASQPLLITGAKGVHFGDLMPPLLFSDLEEALRIGS